MLDLGITNRSAIRDWLGAGCPPGGDQHVARSVEEIALLLIIRDLLRVGWSATVYPRKIGLEPPSRYDKELVRGSMAYRRREVIDRNRRWIDAHIDLARSSLATPAEALLSRIEPSIDVCLTQEQHDLFRVLRYTWSSPYSEYVGRRIRILVRDDSLPRRPVIGLAALGSAIVHIPERDKWVGWTTRARTDNLVFTMDAYVVGSVPPYSYLLGGKLIAALLASNEVRALYGFKYAGRSTEMRNRVATDLACIFTTGLYGKSSQYNRLSYNGHLMYLPIGATKGFGTLHLSDEAFVALRAVMAARKVIVANRFGDGPIWRMRVIRSAAEILGFDSSFLLQHSFRRSIYALPLASNTREFLRGEASTLQYIDSSVKELASHWRDRWLHQRRSQPGVVARVATFDPARFALE